MAVTFATHDDLEELEKKIEENGGTPGEPGKNGNGIKSAVLNADYTLTLNFDDGTSYTTPSIRGATGATGATGSTGSKGADGVGIASIKQTTTSTADDGNNVFTVTLTNGTTATFTVQNGSKGSPGTNGEDYVLTNADKTEIAGIVLEQVGVDGVPDYVTTEAMSVLDKVVAAQGSRTFVLGAITDMHYGSSDYIDGVIHACQGMKHIAKRIKLDAVAVLGDYTDEHQMDTETAVTDLEEMNALLDQFCGEVNLRIKGNHDHRPGSAAQTYRYIFAHNDDVVWGSRIGGYFYRDFPAYKLRVICLNTTEVVRDNLSVSDEQYNFFANSLDLSAKEDCAEWGILILSHHPLDWTVTSGRYCFGNILNAYQTGGSWQDGAVSCDYSGKNAAKIVGNIHGHIHNLLTDKIYVGVPGSSNQTSVWRMAVPAARVDWVNHYGSPWWESTTYNKTQNTADDTAFNIFCIDLDSYTIKAFCYGAGYDRNLTYYVKKEEIINLIDTVGYTDGQRYSASSYGAKDAPGYTLTGSITLSPGEVLYTSGVNFDAAENSYSNIAIVTNDGAWTLVTSSIDGDTSNGKYVAWTIDSANNLTITGGEYITGCSIRLTGYGSGANLIVTKNQPIVDGGNGDNGSDSGATYTNQIPISLADDGSVYNGKGYKENTRYSASSKAESATDGAYTTGWIPVKGNEVVYLKNVSLSSSGASNANNVVFASADKTSTLFNRTIAQLQETGDAVLDANGNVVQFSISWAIVDGAIRINASYIGDDSIVTLNEPIP